MKLLIILLSSLLMVACNTDRAIVLHSPDTLIELKVSLNENRQLRYQINRQGREVLLPSALGIVLDEHDLNMNMHVLDVSPVKKAAQQYSLVQGKQKDISAAANERVVSLKNSQGQGLDIAFRVFNDGVAFQYRFPGKSEDVKVVEHELTTFAFPAETRGWLQPVAEAQTGWKNTNPSYEEHYQVDIPVGTQSPSPAGWVFPALFKTANDWVLISEAGMNGDYHASRLHADSPAGVYNIAYPMEAEIFVLNGNKGELKGQSTLPFVSPWRIIAVGDLATLVESTLGTDLAEPAIADMDFVKPGFASWSWALLKDESVNYQTQKEFIDYAADMNWPYVLVDVEWDKNIGYEKMQELVDYAAQKNVALLLWYNSSGEWNETTYSPKSRLLTREARREEFARLQAMGVKGVKIDFFSGDGKSMMQYYNAILKDAADFELLVNCHGSSLPRGLHRTYPNLMTMEAVNGFEMITFFQGNADRAAEHMTVLPFARNAFDPMDFTPTAFSEIPNIQRLTTNGYEAALPVVFLSGIQHIAETAEGMSQQPEFLKDYLRDIPVLWDETRFIEGYPGKLFVVARRAGERWYVAGINGEQKTKNLDLDLSFISVKQGILITDAEHPRKLQTGKITSGDKVEVSLMANGGFVIVFEERKRH